MEKEIKEYIIEIYNIYQVYSDNNYNKNNTIFFCEVNKSIIDKINNNVGNVYILWNNIEEINYINNITIKNVYNFCYNNNISIFLKKKNIKHELYIYDNNEIKCYKYNYDLIKKPKIAL